MATRTAQQRRAMDKQRYDAYLATCPARDVLQALSDKWVTLVINALAHGPQRYNELSRTIAGVSQKMLTQTLRRLERDGFVTRVPTLAVPVRVDYELTDLGRHFLPVVQSIKTWSEDHIAEIMLARATYDSSHFEPASQRTKPASRS